MPGVAQALHCVGRAGERVAGDVQDAVHVERIAAMNADSIRVTRSVVLPLAEVELQVSRSSGPGGQHAQKSETRVVAVFDVEASNARRRRRSGA